MQLIYLTINRVCKMQQSSNKNFDENSVKQTINALLEILGSTDNKALIREVCNVKANDTTAISTTLQKLENEMTIGNLEAMLKAVTIKEKGQLKRDENNKFILISKKINFDSLEENNKEILQTFDKCLQALQEYHENAKTKEQNEKLELETKISQELRKKIADTLQIQQFTISPNSSLDKGFSKSSGQMRTGIQISENEKVLYYGKAVVKGMYEMFCYKLLQKLGYAPELHFICVPSYQMSNQVLTIPDKSYRKQNYIVLLTKNVYDTSVINPAQLQAEHINELAIQNAIFLNEILHAFSIGDGGTSIGGLVGKSSAMGKTSDKNWVFNNDNKQIKMFDIDPLLVEHENKNENKEKEEEKKQGEELHKKAYTFKEKFDKLYGKKFSKLKREIDDTVAEVRKEVLEQYQQFSNIYCKENYSNMEDFKKYTQNSLNVFNTNKKETWAKKENERNTSCCQIF